MKRRVEYININEIISQIKQNESDAYKIEAITQYLNKRIEAAHNEFNADKDTHNREYYTFNYPFRFLDDELDAIADIIGYKVERELLEKVSIDVAFALEFNKKLKEEKND